MDQPIDVDRFGRLERHGARVRSENRAFEYYERLARVKRHLEQNITEPFTAEAAARVAGLNPTYFSSFFREKVIEVGIEFG